MTRRTAATALLAMFCWYGTPACARPGGALRLGWLAGTWTGTQGKMEMEEHWTSAAGNSLVGMHKDVTGGRMVAFEFLRIQTTPRGIVYLASPGARPATPFRMVEMGKKRVVFENEAHDFPQRILYWLDERGKLHARIEGRRRGRRLWKEWTWTQRRCRTPGTTWLQRRAVRPPTYLGSARTPEAGRHGGARRPRHRRARTRGDNTAGRPVAHRRSHARDQRAGVGRRPSQTTPVGQPSGSSPEAIALQ